MSEHKILRDQGPSNPEVFIVNEPDLGRTFPIREATDQQLAKHLQINQAAQAQTRNQVLVLLNQYTEITRGVAIIEYEIDRRARTLSIVRDLSEISTLRRQ
jgi:hypothetical protein